MFHKQKKLTKPIKKVIQYCYTLPTQQNKQYKNLNISIKTKKKYNIVIHYQRKRKNNKNTKK